MKRIKLLTALFLVALTFVVSAAAVTISIDAEKADKTVVATVSIKDNPGRESPFIDHGSIVGVFADISVWLGIKRIIDQINENAAA